MSQRRPYTKPTRAEVQLSLKREWVPLSTGDVCVWGMTAAEMLGLGQRSQRPSIDPRGGVDTSAAALWLVALCTRHGDQPDSPRVWDDLSIGEIADLPGEDFTALSLAAQRVNGKDTETVEELRDFTTATEAQSSSDSPSSVLSISEGFPVNSDMSPITS